MNANLLVLSAAGLLLASSGAHADPNVINRIYLASVAAQAEARLANAGVNLPGVLHVTGQLSGERLGAVRFPTTGDPATDRRVDATLRKMPIAQVPAELSGRTVALTLGPVPVVAARTR